MMAEGFDITQPGSGNELSPFQTKDKRGVRVVNYKGPKALSKL